MPRRARPTSRPWLLLLLLVPLLAACGGGEQTGDASGASSGTRTVQTAMGPVEVPARAKRVVVLDTGELDLVATLGIRPVGLATAGGGGIADVQSYLRGAATGARRVGTSDGVDLERIAALRPDLILGTSVRVEEQYERLSQIAPTVLGETPAAWKDNVTLWGRALGREADVRRGLAAYERRAAALGRRLGDPGAVTVSVVRFLEGEIRLYAPPSFIGTILGDVGVRLPRTAERETEDINATLSLETLDRADGDVLYTSVYGDPVATDLQRATRSRIWRTLSAVRDGRTQRVDDDVWMLGLGLTSAGKVLDDLERTLPGAARASR